MEFLTRISYFFRVIFRRSRLFLRKESVEKVNKMGRIKFAMTFDSSSAKFGAHINCVFGYLKKSKLDVLVRRIVAR